MIICKGVKFSGRYGDGARVVGTDRRCFTRDRFVGVHHVQVRSGRGRSDGREIQQRNDIGQQSDRAAG